MSSAPCAFQLDLLAWSPPAAPLDRRPYVPPQHNQLERFANEAPSLNIKPAQRWYVYDARPDQRIWICLDPYDQHGINDCATPPAIDTFGRLVR